MKRYLMGLRMQKKLFLPPAFVTLCLLVFGVTAYLGLASQQSVIKTMYNESFAGYRTSAEVSHDMADAHAGIYRLLGWASAQYQASKIEEAGAQLSRTIDKSVENLTKKAESPRISKAERDLYQASWMPSRNTARPHLRSSAWRRVTPTPQSCSWRARRTSSRR